VDTIARTDTNAHTPIALKVKMREGKEDKEGKDGKDGKDGNDTSSAMH
jgi:hypothetical protein